MGLSALVFYSLSAEKEGEGATPRMHNQLSTTSSIMGGEVYPSDRFYNMRSGKYPTSA